MLILPTRLARKAPITKTNLFSNTNFQIFSMPFVYVLLLQDKKYYVGYSERKVGERFLEHFNAQGSQWTRKYHPLQVLQIKQGTKEDEDRTTLEMMLKHGWWNVRGGKWCHVDLQSCPKALLEYQGLHLPTPLFNHAWHISSDSFKHRRTDTGCGRCGRNSHSIRMLCKNKPEWI